MGSFSQFWGMFVQLLNGFGVSAAIFALTLLFALPLGLPLSMGRMSKYKLIRKPVELLLLIVRGTPLMLQIIFVYFAPNFLFNFPLTEYRFPATIIAFSLNYACYFAEIYRGGLESIPVGQHEAAEVLGYSKFQTFSRIVLPQMIKRILPAMGNEVIILVKDTSLAQTIAVLELFSVANSIMSARNSLIPIVLAGLFYLAGSYLITKAFGLAERKLSYYQ